MGLVPPILGHPATDVFARDLATRRRVRTLNFSGAPDDVGAACANLVQIARNKARATRAQALSGTHRSGKLGRGRPRRTSMEQALSATVETASGRVAGFAKDGVLRFNGIPYAKPPVGKLRWRMPEAPEAWAGVRDCARFGAIAPQISGNAEA